jgi:hypothetical protein
VKKLRINLEGKRKVGVVGAGGHIDQPTRAAFDDASVLAERARCTGVVDARIDYARAEGVLETDAVVVRTT